MREKSHPHPSRGPGGLLAARGGLGGDRRSLGEKSGELSLKDVQKARVAHETVHTSSVWVTTVFGEPDGHQAFSSLLWECDFTAPVEGHSIRSVKPTNTPVNQPSRLQK